MEANDKVGQLLELTHGTPIRINYLGKTIEGQFEEWTTKSAPPNSMWLKMYLNLQNYAKYLNLYVERRVITKDQLNKEVDRIKTKTNRNNLIEIGSQGIESIEV